MGNNIADSVANSSAFRYNRTVVPKQGISRIFRVGRISTFTSPNSLITETPAKR